ncbi:hypothetical protein CsSME_00048766 [Camellia sinensis var. sinensis]
MSVVFDVSAVGPTLGLDAVSSSPAAAVYVVDRPPAGGASSASAAQDKTQAYVSSAISSESSSIGVPEDDSDDDDEEGEVQSKSDGSYLSSLASLEESLPIKRGLSNNFAGKSKSFANLSEISTVREIEKRENPLNKRRRTMIAYNWSRKSSLFSCKGNNSSMSILALKGVIGEGREEDDDDDDDDDESNEEDQRFRQQQLKGSQSCFSLTDLPK